MILNKDTAENVAQILLQVKAVKLAPSTPFTWASGWKPRQNWVMVARTVTRRNACRTRRHSCDRTLPLDASSAVR
jgi:hypothetical protein